MKRSIFCLFLFFIYSSGILLASDTPIILNPVPPTNPPYPRSLVQNRTSVVTATLNDTDVVLNFNAAVGLATIAVTDYLGSIVYQQTMDTDSTSELEIPIDSWDSGNYSLTIQFSDVTLSGDFAF